MVLVRDPGVQTPIQLLQHAMRILEGAGWIGGPNCESSEAIDRSGKVCKASSLAAWRFTPFGAIILAGKQDGIRNNSIEVLGWVKLYLSRTYKSPMHPQGFTTYEWNTHQSATKEGILHDLRMVLQLMESQPQDHGLNGRPV